MGAKLGVQGRVQADHVRVGDSQRNRLESRPRRKADGENQRTKGPSSGHPTLRGGGEMEEEAEKGVRRGSREVGGNQSILTVSKEGIEEAGRAGASMLRGAKGTRASDGAALVPPQSLVSWEEADGNWRAAGSRPEWGH